MARFNNDKERQEICIGLARINIVRGINKNGNTYYKLVLTDIEDKKRVIHHEFISYDRISYYLYLVSVCDYDKYNKID